MSSGINATRVRQAVCRGPCRRRTRAIVGSLADPPPRVSDACRLRARAMSQPSRLLDQCPACLIHSFSSLLTGCVGRKQAQSPCKPSATLCLQTPFVCWAMRPPRQSMPAASQPTVPCSSCLLARLQRQRPRQHRKAARVNCRAAADSLGDNSTNRSLSRSTSSSQGEIPLPSPFHRCCARQYRHRFETRHECSSFAAALTAEFNRHRPDQ